MSNKILEVNDAEFSREVLQSEQPVLVDFMATHCGPCRALEPILESLAGDFDGRMKVAQINVDHDQEFAQEYGIRATPTLLLFKGGKVVKQLVGAVPRAKLEAAVREVI